MTTKNIFGYELIRILFLGNDYRIRSASLYLLQFYPCANEGNSEFWNSRRSSQFC